jgi:hypothetical protein
MPSVEMKLAQMHDAADKLRASGARIEISVSQLHQLIDDLTALGFESPAALEFVIRYRGQRTVMDDWGKIVQIFAARLDEAATEIEDAIALNQNGAQSNPEVSPTPPDEATFTQPVQSMAAAALGTGAVSVVHYPRRRKKNRQPVAPFQRETSSTAQPTSNSDSSYVNTQNRALNDEYVQAKAALTDQRKYLEGLKRLRVEKLDELAALKNKLMSENPGADVNNLPGLVGLKQEIATIENNIKVTGTDIHTMTTDLAALQERLHRVAPAPGADLGLIAELELGQTAQIIKDNTQDCVNYIVNRMPVPPGLPTDAHLWVENAHRMTQYGITVGNTPLEGSVLVMEREHPYADDIFGHLMYVEKVEGNMVWVTDNNHAAPTLLSSLTTELTGDNISYLYFPWRTRA